MNPGLCLDSGEFIPAEELNRMIEMKHELPPLLSHPEPHSMTWTTLEGRAIAEYAQQVAEPLLARIAKLEAQLASGLHLPQVTMFSVPVKFGGCPSCGRKGCVARSCTHPAPAQQPLSDEQILDFGPGQPDAVWSYEDQLYFARAIEAAHNIGEKK
jgi:hypothetical protein